MLNKNYFLAFLAVCLFTFSSCTKEDIDTTTTTEEETPVEVVECEGFSILLGESSGTIVVEVIGGTAPYTFAWSTEEMTTSITPEENGTYSVTVSDAEGCDATAEITFEAETDDCAGFGMNITHEGEGQLTAELTAGTAPYTFVWSTDENSEEVTVSESGVYSLTVTDANGCVVIDEIAVTLNPGECDGALTLDAPNTMTAIAFSAQSEAYLWKDDCSDISGGSDYDHNYVVVDMDWDSWGTNNELGFYDISDGIPGISFGSNGVPQVGDILSPYFVGDDYFYYEAAGVAMNYDLDDVQITITETSNELGGQIAGTISGTIVDQNDPDNTSTVSGAFCVSIVSVCE